MHPYIGDLSSLTLEEIQNKLDDLNKKMNIVARSGNTEVMYQLQLVMQDYQYAYKVKLAEVSEQQNGPDKHKLTDNINIS